MTNSNLFLEDDGSALRHIQDQFGAASHCPVVVAG